MVWDHNLKGFLDQIWNNQISELADSYHWLSALHIIMHGIVLTFMSNRFQSEQMFTEIFEQRFHFNPQPMAVAGDRVMRLPPSVQPCTAFRCMYKRWMWWATNQLEGWMPEEPPGKMTCTRSSAAVVSGGLSRCVFAGGPCHYQPSVSVSSWCSQSSSPAKQ